MGWKNLPSWVRGGVLFTFSVFLISIILGLIIATIYNNIPIARIDNNYYDSERGFFLIFFLVFFIVIFLLPSFLIGFIKSSPGSFGMEGNFIVALLVSLFTWFVIGGFIWFIIGKIKQKEKRQNEKV